MSYRKRRLKRHTVELDITAFMNLIVVLVPFLLTSVVFTRLAVIEMNLPSAASGPTEIPKSLQLEVTIRPRAIEVGNRQTGLIQRIDSTAQGYDYAALSNVMQQLKSRFPDKLEATILSEPDTAYDTLVQVMDAVRAAHKVASGKSTRIELFPDISVGDAPPAASVSKGG
ncbi:MAG: biopolymer transporter ExbD [Gammaproteobacteria bacterium]|nr:biopolymer transporter ExbD [Gammaproteobacteria bacterium]